jgi:hypothetical protein
MAVEHRVVHVAVAAIAVGAFAAAEQSSSRIIFVYPRLVAILIPSSAALASTSSASSQCIRATQEVDKLLPRWSRMMMPAPPERSRSEKEPSVFTFTQPFGGGDQVGSGELGAVESLLTGA